MQSTAGFIGEETRCGSVSMRASPDQDINVRIDRLFRPKKATN
jgi:hypothetical protein